MAEFKCPKCGFTTFTILNHSTARCQRCGTLIPSYLIVVQNPLPKEHKDVAEYPQYQNQA